MWNRFYGPLHVAIYSTFGLGLSVTHVHRSFLWHVQLGPLVVELMT